MTLFTSSVGCEKNKFVFVFFFLSENQKSNTLQLHLQGLMEILPGGSMVAQLIKNLPAVQEV